MPIKLGILIFFCLVSHFCHMLLYRTINGKKKKLGGHKKKTKPLVSLVDDSGKDKVSDENKEKVSIMSMIADELSDPARDCRKFDPMGHREFDPQ